MRTWFPVRVMLSLLAVLGGVNCAGNEATPQAFEAETCPAQADSCPAECVLAEAYLLDIERECREKRVLGCQGPAAGVDIQVVCDGAGAWDPDRLTQTDQNLRTKAIEYSPLSSSATRHDLDATAKHPRDGCAFSLRRPGRG